MSEHAPAMCGQEEDEESIGDDEDEDWYDGREGDIADVEVGLVSLVFEEVRGDERSRAGQVHIGRVLEKLGEVEYKSDCKDGDDGYAGAGDGTDELGVEHEAERDEAFDGDSHSEPAGGGDEHVVHYISVETGRVQLDVDE